MCDEPSTEVCSPCEKRVLPASPWSVQESFTYTLCGDMSVAFIPNEAKVCK